MQAFRWRNNKCIKAQGCGSISSQICSLSWFFVMKSAICRSWPLRASVTQYFRQIAPIIRAFLATDFTPLVGCTIGDEEPISCDPIHPYPSPLPQIGVEGRFRNPQHLTNLLNSVFLLVVQLIEQLHFGRIQGLGSTPCPASGSGSTQAGQGPLPDQVALKLG